VRPWQAAARKSVYVETYGCQMNVNDSEVGRTRRTLKLIVH
jgi:tRNA A37 methylthiotransferase MiaB